MSSTLLLFVNDAYILILLLSPEPLEPFGWPNCVNRGVSIKSHCAIGGPTAFRATGKVVQTSGGGRPFLHALQIFAVYRQSSKGKGHTSCGV